MKPENERKNRLSRFLVGTLVTVTCGLLLLTRIGEWWVDTSYDYLFRFNSRSPTNNVILVRMDTHSRNHLQITNNVGWRPVHTRFLNQLADDGCPLVVVDVFFKSAGDAEIDEELAAALRRQKKVVLSAWLTDPKHPGADSVSVYRPLNLFLESTGSQWGVAQANAMEPSEIVRRHWPFPAEQSNHPSLAWKAAELAGANLSEQPRKQWLRYYSEEGPAGSMSYILALDKPAGYFSDKIVFIGSQPETSALDGEDDEFLTPYSRWKHQATGGVEIMATQFLNLVNGDWLRRWHWFVECIVVVITGLVIGAGLCRVRPLFACVLAAASVVGASLAGVLLSQYTNYWFPWAIVSLGQVPAALACSIVFGFTSPARPKLSPTDEKADSNSANSPPVISDHKLVKKIGQGSYGEVWLARNAVGMYRAVKIVFRDRFEDAAPYEREFRGIEKFMPVSLAHPGLLNVLHVGRDDEQGCFFYIMEAGDDENTGAEIDPDRYRAKTLASELNRLGTLPARDALELVLPLTEALGFLHERRLVHRDIKPANIIYVNGSPKLADIGLVTRISADGAEATLVGTRGFLLTESAGTVAADLYALGKVLYVSITGLNPEQFPELPDTFEEHADFTLLSELNEIAWKACGAGSKASYQSAGQMHAEIHKLRPG